MNVSIVKSSSARLGGMVVVSRVSITESMIHFRTNRTQENENYSQSAELPSPRGGSESERFLGR